MSELGFGAMIHLLSGGSEISPKELVGKKIVSAKLDNKGVDSLQFELEDGTKYKLWDNGQSCCESRYITTDDNPADLVGQTLISIETRDLPGDERDGDTHEEVSIIIQGDKSAITLVTHNQHNGYYGGFGLTITKVDE